jgi:polar amino acid transport system substrate-binding protein
VDFTIPYYVVTQVLVVQPDDDRSLEQVLKSKDKIGVQRGTVTNKLLKKLQKKADYNFEIVEYDSTDLSLQDMAIGRIAGSGMDSSIANELLKTKDFKVAGTFEAPPENYAYAVREEDNELLRTLNEGLRMLMDDPYWEELKAKWEIY